MNCVCKLHVRAAEKGYRILTTSNGAIMKRVNTTFNKALSQYPQRMNQKRSPPVLQRRNPFSLETTKSQPTEKYRCENFAHAKILWKTNKHSFKMEFYQVCKDLADRYKKETTTQVKYLDAFIVFSAVTAILQAVYCFLVGTYPFNAFLAGFIASLGSCVLSGMTHNSALLTPSVLPNGNYFQRI